MAGSKQLAAILVALVGIGCGDDDAPPPEQAPDTDGSTSESLSATTTLTETDPTMGTDSGDGPMSFLVTIENLSNRTALPTPFSPGVWATHDSAVQLFGPGDGASLGLERLAEDGNPRELADALNGEDGVASSGVFDTPRNAGVAGPALPADTYEIEIMASADRPLLSFAMMVVQTNDIFLATAPEGIALFDESGRPIEATDITNRLRLWDAGTEANEAPGMGRQQAPRQEVPDSGPPETGVYPFVHETRGLPLASGIVEVTVEELGGEYTIAIENVSADRGAIATAVSPVFWAVHDASFAMFEVDAPARDGLEALAEDGDPSAMVEAHRRAAGVLAVGMVDTPADAGMPRPAEPGERFELVVTPNEEFQWLSLATMVVETNDAFLALPPGGVALVDEFGNPRDAATVEDEIRRMLAVWDAGTEQNEVPGVGANQAPRQPALDTGLDDERDTVRRYSDFTNDLAGPMAGGFVDLRIVGTGDGSFEVTLRNTSDATAYPGQLSPLMWMLHDPSSTLFGLGEEATRGLESLAEDGNPMRLSDEMANASGVMTTGTVAVPDGATEARPLAPGEAYAFTVTPTVDAPLFSFAAMIIPSNDTFVAFADGGVALLDESGAPRNDAAIAQDVARLLQAWDAGTEANQAGAAGPDQPPRQSGPNEGSGQGDATIRAVDRERVWALPRLQDIVRVTIRRRS